MIQSRKYLYQMFKIPMKFINHVYTNTRLTLNEDTCNQTGLKHHSSVNIKSIIY